MQFMVDCSVLLNHRVDLVVSQRNLRVQKYRGSGFNEDESPFVIGKTGFDVAMARTLGRADAKVSNGCVSSGVERLDIRVAVDDFRTGYSSLSYLHRFPIDTLKIDQSFVRAIDTPDGVSLVKAIIDMGCCNLGLMVIAEGVETEHEAIILAGMGCERAQGYYFSRPLPPANLPSLLEQHAQPALLVVRASERDVAPA